MSANHAERADAYLHGLLTPAESTQFERQLADDAVLRAALDTARRRQSLLEAALPPAESSEPLVQATLAKIDDFRRRQRRWRRRTYSLLFAPVTACALIVALFHTHYSQLAASPANLEVYGQNTLIPGSEGALRVRLTDKHTQAPIAGVPVEITLGELGGPNFVTLASFTTDARGNGQPAFRLPDWADGSYPLRVTAQTPKTPEVLTQRVTLKRSAKLLLTSDKPVYQPGQTIHLRALTLMRPDLKPAADAETMFTISDPRGNVIFRSPQRTSRFGIAAVDCPLADELIEGNYRVHCRVGDTDSALALDVKKYVLPKIRVTLATAQPWYQPGQEVRVTLHAAYHHGEPVADAQWALEATLGPTNLLTKLSGRTDADGNAAFAFRLPAESNGEMTLAAQVRDRAGQKATGSLRKWIADRPFRLTVIPENGVLVPGVPNTVYVHTAAPDGEPVRVKGTVTAGSETLPVVTGELGVGVLTITPAGEDLLLSFDLTDSKGSRQIDAMTMQAGEPVGDYLIRTDKAVYASGDTMRLSMLASGSGPVFLDILKDDQTVRSEVIDVANGRGELALDIPAELFGTLQLCSYRFDRLGRLTRKTRTIYIRPAHELRIGVRPDRPEYRPGARAKLDFTLTDEKGKPVAGALSLAMVDEAVFDVKQQLPGLERTFYLLEQKLLQGATTPWTPDAAPDAPADQRAMFEQAFFAGTARVSYPTETPYATKTKYDTRAPSGPVQMPHTLTGETYSRKKQETDSAKYTGLRNVNFAWVLLGLWVVVTVYVVLWMNVRLLYVLILHGIGAVLLTCGGLVLLSFVVLERSIPGSKMSAGAAKSRDTQSAPAAMANFGPLAPPGAVGPPRGHSEPQIRVRERFPETMLWRPQLITDDAGRASLDLELADSITTWRLSASAVSADGALGALQSGLRVFQPFFVDLNLPVTLTRGDEIDVPAVVSNFLPRPQTVELTLGRAGWFELVGADALKLELKPREVRSASFRIRVKQVGKHELRVTAKGPDLGDAVKREIEVVPDGRRVEQVTSGILTRATSVKLDLPADAVEGSGKVIVRIYPSSFSQVVDGLEGIFRLPTGCFEQTSSSLYPNVMALSYLRGMNKRVPEVEARAVQYIHAGYQRLLSFEVPGGGFDWYGRPPANVTLTAYGLMDFRDMARVHDVDPKLIERTRGWLLAKRNADGSWDDDRRYGPEPPVERRLRATAYVAAAVFDGNPGYESAVTRAFLVRHPPETVRGPYVLALICNALLAMDPKDEAVRPYLDRLASLKQISDDGRKVWWPLGAEMTTFYGSGRCGDVEATALAALVLLRAEQHPELIRPALAWIVEQRQVGHWGSTQATVLALKALLAGTGKATADGPRRIEVALGGEKVQTLDIPPDQAEVMKQLDLSGRLKPGMQGLTLTDRGGNAPGFQVEFRYHVPGKAAARPESLSIDLKYNRDTLTPADTLTVTATATNRQPQPAAMVMLELPVPPGFRVETDDFERLVQPGTIARFEVTARQITVYLRGLDAGKTLALTYRLKPGEPAILAVPPARIYEYYNPDREGRSASTRLTVTARK